MRQLLQSLLRSNICEKTSHLTLLAVPREVLLSNLVPRYVLALAFGFVGAAEHRELLVAVPQDGQSSNNLWGG